MPRTPHTLDAANNSSGAAAARGCACFDYYCAYFDYYCACFYYYYFYVPILPHMCT